jgi:hypothetical protein
MSFAVNSSALLEARLSSTAIQKPDPITIAKTNKRVERGGTFLSSTKLRIEIDRAKSIIIIVQPECDRAWNASGTNTLIGYQTHMVVESWASRTYRFTHYKKGRMKELQCYAGWMLLLYMRVKVSECIAKHYIQ